MVGGFLELEMESAILRENRVASLTCCGRIVARKYDLTRTVTALFVC
jgi:hypothetical protein